MTDIVLDEEHDLLISEGDIFLFSELDKLTAQKVEIRLLNYRGEWFRDVNTGVPYLQQILGRRDTKDTADVVIKDTILSTDNIESLISYESTINSERNMSIIFSATMVSGGSIQNITVEI